MRSIVKQLRIYARERESELAQLLCVIMRKNNFSETHFFFFPEREHTCKNARPPTPERAELSHLKKSLRTRFIVITAQS